MWLYDSSLSLSGFFLEFWNFETWIWVESGVIIINISVIYLWNLLLCNCKLFLDERVFSQKSHEIDIPSKWLDSIWSLIWFQWPSLPHTLQIDNLACMGVPFARFPAGIIFSPFSIIDFTFSSRAWRLVPDWSWTTSSLESLSKASVSDVIDSLLLAVIDVVNKSLLIFAGSEYPGISCFSNVSSLEVCPSRPFNLISSAMARKESKHSW